MTVKANDGPRRDQAKTYNDQACKKPVDSKQNAKSRREKTTAPPTKIVVRRLPPLMKEEEFLEVVAPLPDHDYFTFSHTDNSLGVHAFNRAYINFKNVEDVYTFKDRFDGYVFVDQKGDEYPAMVEFAPFQKIPKRSGNKKKDARCGTIDEDPDFLAFMESLTNPAPINLPNLEAVLEEIQAYDREFKSNNGLIKIKTPLLEFIEHKKAEKLRNKEEKREERRRKDFERKKAKEEDKRRKKDGKDHRETKRREEYKDLKDPRDDSCVKVLRPERVKDEQIEGKTEKSRMERDKERAEREKEKQRRRDEDKQKQRERERERREKDRLLRREREKEERIRRQEERIKGKDEELGRLREDTKDEGFDEKPINKMEGARSKRYSEGRRKEERERERKYKEHSDRERRAKDAAVSNEAQGQEVERNEEKAIINDRGLEDQSQPIEKNKEKTCGQTPDKYGDMERPVEKPTRKRREKDPRAERRIRNKDRPAMALYRPGQSRLSTSHSRSEKGESGETCSSSPSPVMIQGESNVFFGKECNDDLEEPSKSDPISDVIQALESNEPDSDK